MSSIYKTYFKVRSRGVSVLMLLLFILCSNFSKAGTSDTISTSVSALRSVNEIPGLVSDEDELRAGLLFDVKRNTIVWQKDMDYSYPIASLTKMMVGLLAIEDVESGKVCLDDRIKVTRTYKKKISRRRYACVSTQEEYSFEDILKMAMVASHNESTIWIARHCDEDVSVFVERMNKRARELGMTKTLYSNTSGLPAIIDELDNSASANDMLTLALEVLKHPQLMDITSIPYADVKNGRSSATYRNHNGLVINYNSEVDGIKTGYTKAAKFCLVASSYRGGYRMISVVFGVRSPWVRNGIVASMLNTYYDAIKIGRLGDAPPDLAASNVFLDSVSRGLTSITPSIEPRHKDSSDESYAYTYKTVNQKVKKIYVVRSGDNLGKIAGKYNVSVSNLKSWNHLKGNSILAGQKLAINTTVKKRIPVKLVVDPDESYADNQPSIPDNTDCETQVTNENVIVSDNESDATEVPLTNAVVEKSVKAKPANKEVSGTATAAKPSFIYHTVQPGDTLWNIAQRYQANVDQIKRVNKISNSHLLKSGTRIKIPVNGG